MVILGHLIPGEIRQTFPRYAIYGFHMPLFFGICGYFIPRKSLTQMTFFALVRKYWKRILLPWILAIQVFFVLENFDRFTSLTLSDYWKAYYLPYVHLWFIPGFFTFILLTWLFLNAIRLVLSMEQPTENLFFREHPASSAHNQILQNRRERFTWIVLFSCALLLSIVFCIYMHQTYETAEAINLQYLVMHDFHLYYYIFFVFGMFLRDTDLNLTKPLQQTLRSAMFLFGILYLILFFFPNVLLEEVLKYCFNLLLIHWALTACQTLSLPRNKTLEYIGRNSLAYYLYVQAAKTFTLHFFPYTETLWGYWLCVIPLTYVTFLIIGRCNKIPFIRHLFFGL
mgnify:CR=1 FL=1